MTVKPLGARDHRIDILRALALISIFINHIPGNVLEPFTHKNFGLSDSAEAFVLLAGIASAFAYYPRFAAGDAFTPLARIGKRVVTLYVAHLASLTVGLGLYCYANARWGMPIDGPALNISPILADPLHAMVGIPLMTQQIGYHNILPLYVCLLVFLPALMAAARCGSGVMLGLSVTVYGLAHVLGLIPPAYPSEGGWFFNPFTWQLIFAVGFFVGKRVLEGRVPVPYHPLLWWAGLGYLVAAGIFHHYNFYGTMPTVGWLPQNFLINEKPWVALPRLTHILALAYVVGHSRVMAWLGGLSPDNGLARMGRHSLPVFWTGTALSVLGQVIFFRTSPGAFAQLVLIAAGIGLQMGLAHLLDAMAAAGKRRRPVPDAVAAAA